MGEGGPQVDELLKYSDAFLVALTMVFAAAIRPWLQGPDGVAPRNRRERIFEGDRFVLAVLVLGITMGCGAEYASPDFDAHMAFRRVLASAGGASMGFMLWRTYVVPKMNVGAAK